MTRSDSLYESHPRLWRRLLAMVYGAAVAGRGQLQRLGLLKTRRLPVRVICVGNLTVGGNGQDAHGHLDRPSPAGPAAGGRPLSAGVTAAAIRSRSISYPTVARFCSARAGPGMNRT